MRNTKANFTLNPLAKKIALGLFGLLFISMNGCDGFYSVDKTSIKKLQAKKEWVVLTTESPLIYSRSKNGEAFGIDHDLLQSFAKTYGLTLRYEKRSTEQAVLEALARGEGDIAAARLRTPLSSEGFQVGPAYEDTYLSLYCHDRLRVSNIQDLRKKTVALLEKDDFQGLSTRLQILNPQIKVQVVSDIKTRDLLAHISKKKSDCVIVENMSGDFYSRQFKQIEKVSVVSAPYSLSWILAPAHSQLARLMSVWFKQAARNDKIMEVHDRYGNYLEELDHRDVQKFLRMIESTLPTYKKNFRSAGAEHRLPWELIASVAYQESHWNPEAQSYTGVRGIMQLTTSTALYLGIEDREDPTQSIQGGAKYLRYLLSLQPKNLNSKDQLALALAAYNIGWAHLKDAQSLAVQMGKNPYSWRHLREILPLLEEPEYAKDLRYGGARGNETVAFVERVKSFYNLLSASPRS
jgi:membrane-bound lytic murein transglycosylase F